MQLLQFFLKIWQSTRRDIMNIQTCIAISDIEQTTATPTPRISDIYNLIKEGHVIYIYI